MPPVAPQGPYIRRRIGFLLGHSKKIHFSCLLQLHSSLSSYSVKMATEGESAPAAPSPETAVENVKRSGSNQPDKANAEGKIGGGRPNKRQRIGPGSSTIEPPKSREEMTPEELKATLKRQVEYYLSDANLATDAFFHGKIEEAEKQGHGVSCFSSFRLRLCRFTVAAVTWCFCTFDVRLSVIVKPWCSGCFDANSVRAEYDVRAE